MYSTEFNTCYKQPIANEKSIVGKYIQYPNSAHMRIAEGGMRLHGIYKERSITNPLVSVITTVRNGRLLVEKAMCSVLLQSYQNIEYIIIDSASTDRTLNVITKYNDVLDYFISEPDNGIYEGMNKGLELALGDYIIFLNADDWYIPEAIETLVNEVLSFNLDFACALAIETNEYGGSIRKIPMMPFKENIRMRMPLRHETMLVSRELYNKVGLYDPSYKIIGDLKMTQKIYDQTSKYRQLNQYLMFFRKMGAAHKLTKEFLLERCSLLKEQFPFLEEEEANLLAKEFRGDISDYKFLMEKYHKYDELVKGIEGFLSLHGYEENTTKVK